MASANTYDENLLSQAPEVTRAELQDGYNADLLREPTVKRTHSARATHPPAPRSNSDPHQQYPMSDKDIESSAAPLQPKEGIELKQSRKPWWRTGKGIAIIAGVVIVIILVAVLGGVLGSRKRGPKTSNGGAEGVANGDQGQGNSGTGNSAGSVPLPSGSPAASGSGTTTVNQAVATGTPHVGNSGGIGGANAGGNSGTNTGGNSGTNTGGNAGETSANVGGGTGTESGVLPQPQGGPSGLPPATGGATSATPGRDELSLTERDVEMLLRDLGVKV